MAQLKLCLFGYPTVELNKGPVAMRERKSLALLAYLAMSGARHSREALGTLLWPEHDQSKVYTNLRHALWSLKHAGMAAWLAVDRNTIGLHPGYWLDVAAFRQAVATDQLEMAVSLYRADFLADLIIHNAPEFEIWAFGEAEQLRQTLAGALQRLTLSYGEQGLYNAAITYGLRWLQLDPLHEPAHQQLMRLYAWAGQYSAAIRQYEECVRRLNVALGCAPDAETVALYQALRTKQAPLHRVAARQDAPAAPRPPTSGQASGVAPDAVYSLPAPSTPLIGRTAAMADLCTLVFASPARLVTLVGPGGVGKTRLAFAAAQSQMGRCIGGPSLRTPPLRFPNGICFVELASLDRPSLVGQAVVSALDLHIERGRDLTDTICEYLQDRCLLLVLDNCEHLAAACANLAEAILRACPQVSLLATGREPLGIASEIIWPLAPLVSPDADGSADPDAMLRYEAIQLFVERARAVRSTFTFSPANAQIIAQICHKLDGLPLAIELAAACVSTLTVEQIAARLNNRFHLLTAGYRTALPRQQTLRATIDWSYGLIPAAARILLRRLTVFADGWTLEAVERVCADRKLLGDDILGALSHLVKTSLVIAGEPSPGDPDQHRYRLLETIQQYGLEKLADAGETEWMHERHLRYFGELAAAAALGMCSAEQMAWVERLDTERANLRTAFEWALRCNAAVGQRAALELACALGAFWDLRGYYSEGRDWLEQALAVLPAAPDNLTPVHAEALYTLGVLASRQSDFDVARVRLTESQALWRAAGDQRGIGRVQSALGQVALFQGDYAGARLMLEESVATLSAVGEPWGFADTLRLLGMAAWEQGDYATARRRLAESIARSREPGDLQTLANALNYLGELRRSEGDYQGAAELYEESRAIFQQLGNTAISAMVYGNLLPNRR